MEPRFFIFLILFSCMNFVPAENKLSRPNIIFILIDDMGWTDLTCYGSDFYETPNLDRLAKEGMRFTDAYAACTVCSPTRGAFLTGQSPARTHLTNWIPGSNSKGPYALTAKHNWVKELKQGHVTIAEALKQEGYTTALFGKWHLGHSEQSDPLNHGFDINIGGGAAGMPATFFYPYFTRKKLKSKEEFKAVWESRKKSVAGIGPMPEGKEGDYLTDILTDEAIKMIEASKDKPFFQFISYYNVHKPDDAKQADIDYYKNKTPGEIHKHVNYAAKVKNLDENIGRIVKKLKDLQLNKKTIIFFTSDNGGQPSTKCLPLRYQKGSAYEGGVRVPLIINGPGVPAGVTSGEPVTTVDYYTTILDLVQAKADPQYKSKLEGASITPLFRDSSAKLNRSLYWHYPHSHPGGAKPYAAVRSGNWKLIEFFEGKRAELYNLNEDIGEKNDLAEKFPEKLAQLRKDLYAWQKKVKAQIPKE